MKKLILLLVTINLSNVYGQEKKLAGIYTEYKRTLLNGDDGTKYTIDQKPFDTKLQFEFTNGSVIIYDGGKKTDNNYSVNGDTLVFSMNVGKDQNLRTIYTKYIIVDNRNDLVIKEFKGNLDENYYLRKYYFKKEKAIRQDYLMKDNYDIFTVVEESPTFPNGSDAMKKFINDELQNSNLKGSEKVFLKALINPEGKIAMIDILNNPKVEYAEEAIRIARKLPNFNPGKQNGKPVFVYYNFPVKFNP